RLQAGVRMRRHDHPARRGHVIRPVMVGEAPGADERPTALGERAPHGHRARTAEGYHPRLEQLDLAGRNRVGLAQEFLRLDLEVAHTGMLTCDTVSSWRSERLGPCSETGGAPNEQQA